MASTDLHGQPLPPPRTKKPPPTPRVKTTEAEKRLDRTAKYYAHCAPPADARETEWRHGKWAGKRQKVRAALAACGTHAVTLSNFDACGSEAVVQWSETAQKRRISAHYCHSRHCEPCARAKGNKIAANLKNRLASAGKNEYRLITLTLKHSKTPLADQIRRIYKCFKKLRATAIWKKTQKGGAAILEVKWTGAEWHPHLHAVVQGKYLDKFQLSALWHQVTGDSFIVDLRVISRAEDAAHYVTKYVTKSTSDSVWTDPNAAAEWITASKGVRTCGTFGSWRGYKLLAVSHAVTDWVSEDKLTRFFERARNGERHAQIVLDFLRPPAPAEESNANDRTGDG